jgi:putative acetyltransferase
MPPLRPLTPADHDALVEVYRDAVLSQTQGLYSQAQIAAWAGHADHSGVLQQPLREGFGLASTAEDLPAADRPGGGRLTEGKPIEAFGILHPPDRLALLYCRGRSCRQGRSSAILEALERHAAQLGRSWLRTEASQLSRPLLLRRGWLVEQEERVLFAGEWFQRWRMIKALAHPSIKQSRG